MREESRWGTRRRDAPGVGCVKPHYQVLLVVDMEVQDTCLLVICEVAQKVPGTIVTSKMPLGGLLEMHTGTPTSSKSHLGFQRSSAISRLITSTMQMLGYNSNEAMNQTTAIGLCCRTGPHRSAHLPLLGRQAHTTSHYGSRWYWCCSWSGTNSQP